MNKFKVVATAPTVYQYSSLKHFGMVVEKVGNGSFTAQEEFETEQDAKEYLAGRATMYYDEYENQADTYLQNIENYGILEIDGTKARIVEIED